MADDVEMTPVEMTPVEASEPPKANPLAKPGATVGLKPGLRLPPKPGATVALKPGLKLPPKPGATVGLKPGLRLPPKPGSTVALKPGLKLPPKPGITAAKPVAPTPAPAAEAPKPEAPAAAAPVAEAPKSEPVQETPKAEAPVAAAPAPAAEAPKAAPVISKPGATVGLKPGLRLPAKPVIRKPGATVLAKPLPKPVTPAAAAPETAPATPAAPAPAAEAPKSVPVDAQGVGKLPTVVAKPIGREEPAPVVSENPNSLEALKTVTQKLKGITQQIPQQAILRKTGIIAEETMTDAQKQAAKSKTARISLSDAMGVAPVKNESPLMKTIKIKRPIDIPGATGAKLSKPVVPASVEAPAAEAPAPAEGEGDSSSTITQRKTLKIARPGGGAVRPTGKFGVRRPMSQATTVAKKPANANAEGESPALAPVGDISDIPAIPDMPAAMPVAQSDGPAWLWTISALVQAAACVAIGALAWFLFQNTQVQYF